MAPGTSPAMPTASGGRRSGTVEPPAVRVDGPRTPTQLADDAFAFVRRHPRETLSVAAAFVIPFALILAFAQRDLFDSDSFDALTSGDPSLVNGALDGSGGGLTLLGLALGGVALALTTAGLATLVAAERAGRALDPRTAIEAALRRSPAVVGAWVLVHVFEAIGLLALVVGAFFVAIALTVTVPALAVEGIGPVAAMKRSNELTSRRRGPVLGVMAVSFFVESFVGSALGTLPGLLPFVADFPGGWLVVGVGTAAVALVTTPFVALVSIELYLDLRVRVEALDIEMRMPDLFESA